MATPDRILTLYYKHRPGGHCRRLYMMITALLEQGYEVHYLSTEKFPLPENENLVAHLLKLPCRKNTGLWFWLCFTFATIFSLCGIARRTPCLAIAVFDPYYSLVAKLASLITRTRIILFMRSVPWRANFLAGDSALARWAAYSIDALGLLFAHKIVTVTSVMHQELVSKLPWIRRKIVTLPNAVVYPENLSTGNRKHEISMQMRLSEKNLQIVTTGELNSRRNVEHLLRAVGACTSEKINLIVCGDGPEMTKLSVLTVGLGLTERVILAGWVKDPVAIVAGCDLFVMPSRHEGMSNSLLEALGAGVPVIAADTPEMKEVLASPELLFDPTDVGKLARFFDNLVGSRSELEQLRKLSTERARLFTFDWGQEVVKLLANQ